MYCDRLQQWAEENGVKGIRFYPQNPSASSAEGIASSAYKAIKAFEAGRSTKFEDCVRPEDCDHLSNAAST